MGFALGGVRLRMILPRFFLSTLSLTRYLVGIGVVGVLVYMCSVGGVVSVAVKGWVLGFGLL